MPLHVNGLVLAETKRNVYRVQLAPDQKPEDLLSPDWWVHVARQMRVNDRIEVVGYGNAWFAEVMVLEVGKGGHGGARVAYILGPVELDNAAAVAAPAEYQVRWGGDVSKWIVVAAKDKKLVKDGFETIEDGKAWIAGLTDKAA